VRKKEETELNKIQSFVFVVFTKQDYQDKIKEDEMVGDCSSHRTDKSRIQNFSLKPEGINLSEGTALK
jgi:hypothetical protein